MEQKKNIYSIKNKMHIFVILTVLVVASGTSAIAFHTSVNQINQYYKRCAADNARNFVSFVDGDYVAKLRKAAESEEFQALREQAEENEDEEIIRTYLMEHDLWEGYSETQKAIDTYLENMKDIKYIYLSAATDPNATEDMYILDSSEEPIYETGFYEKREDELLGHDLTKSEEPTISNGDWGWLCSAFSPVYASDGSCVCVVGCDFGMEDVMAERHRYLIYLIIGTVIFTLIVQFIAVRFINKTVVKPLDFMTGEMEKFKPKENLSYEEAGVINLEFKGRDEIYAIYQGIRSMQTNIIDYLNYLSVLQRHQEKAEKDLKAKEKQIDQLSEENNRDALTGVGSKAAYARKVEELNQELAAGTAEFAIVMVDMNNLKQVNDQHGHKAGDLYIKGCCHMVCEAFKHSPVYRIGGDEFIVILQGIDYVARQQIFDQLRADYEITFLLKDTEPWFRYSAALGMAENAFGDATYDLVFKRADKAMYEDKMRFKAQYGSYR